MKICPLATLFLLVTVASTVRTAAQLPAMNFELITTKDGLPSNTVLSATRDKNGFMWFGTRQCPVRYDGVSFRAFNDYATFFVSGIKADSSNNIWFASDRSGVSVIDAVRFKMQQVVDTDSSEANSAGFFYIDKYGYGWYSDHYGVNRIKLEDRTVRHYPLRQSSYVWTKASFVEDGDDNLWVIGRDNGVFRFHRDSDSLECVLGADYTGSNDNYNDLLISNGIFGNDGYLWLTTYNYGLVRYDPVTNDIKSFSTGRRENQLLAVEEGLDENGRRILWVGDNLGVGLFRPDQQRFYFFEDLLPRPYEVYDIYRDEDAIVWICSSEGIIKYHPAGNIVQSLSIPEPVLRQGEITFIHQDIRNDRKNVFYLGTSNNALLIWNRTTNTFERIEYPGRAGETKWIRQDKGGKLWIGTNRWNYTRPGIFLFDPSTNSFLQNQATLAANKLFSVPFFMYGLLTEEYLWVGNSDEGVHVIDMQGKDVTPWLQEEMKRVIANNNLINDITLDNDGRLHLGTYKGIYYYDPQQGHFIHADSKNLPSGADDFAVNTLIFLDGNVWAARWGSLTRGTGDNAMAVGLNAGFGDREIKGLVTDYKSNLWIGNHEGLYRYQVNTGVLDKLTMNDGLIADNTINRIFSTHDKKEILVSHNTGFSLLNVDALDASANPPAVVITGVKVHQTDYPLNHSEGVVLKPDQNVLSVDFVALNYRKQDDNQYAYFLEGFDEDWNYVGSQHVAYYTNLNPGEYVLHMKARDSRGIWNENELKLPIRVLPAYYQTAWFRTLMVLLLACALYAVYRYRINQLLRLQQVRNRISADLHDELGSTLSGIGIMGTLAKREITDPEKSGALIDRMMEDVRQISSSVDDIVWNISPKNDTLASLIARMTRYASELFEAKQIAFYISTPDDVENIRLSMEQRRNVYLIFKESVNNLVKYSKCSEASVNISILNNSLHMIIKDNGIGFNPNVQTDRNGIRNLQERAKVLNGRIDIRSAKGEGTCVSFALPVHADPKGLF